MLYIINLHSFNNVRLLPKGRGPRFQTRHVNGGMFFEILVGGTKRGDSIFCISLVGDLVKVGQFFLN